MHHQTQERHTVGLLGAINHLRLTVTDIPRARKFYDPLLRFMGYELVEADAKRLAWAQWGPNDILHWFILSEAKDEFKTTPHDRYATGFHHLAWNAHSREQVDAFHQLLMVQNVSVLDAPAEYDYEPGYYAVFFSDPDGLKLEFMHVAPAGSSHYWRTHKARPAP